jgi:hypothetical protein
MTAAATATTAMSEAARIIAAPYRDGSRIGLLWIRHPGLRQRSGMTPDRQSIAAGMSYWRWRGRT